MSTQVQFRRGTTAEHSSFTGALGEVTIDTERNVCVVHDATTAGGFGTAILALGIGLLGYSMFKSKTIHVISSSAFMLVGIIGLFGSILFYDQGLIAAYYFSLTITTVATGIELIRTGK